MLTSIFCDEAFYNCIRCSPDIRIKNLDAAWLCHLIDSLAFTIENDNNAHAAKVLILRQNFYEISPSRGAVAAVCSKQFGPGQDDAVTIHNEKTLRHQSQDIRKGGAWLAGMPHPPRRKNM